jgi:hypothetical protein
MAFPFSVRGEITLDFAGELAAVSDAIRQALLEERPRALTLVGNRIEFRGGLGAGGLGNWHLLQPISTGSIEIRSLGPAVVVGYELRFTGTLAMVSFMAFGLLAPTLIVQARMPLLAAILISGGVWLWLFGGNYSLSAWRFKGFLRRLVLPVRP